MHLLAIFISAALSLPAQPSLAREIQGRVLDSSDVSVKDAQVFLYKVAYRSYGISDDAVIAEGRTDGSGAFAFKDIRIAAEAYTTFYVLANAPGRAVDWELVEGGEPGEQYVLRLGLPERITGGVVDDDGAPLAAAAVWIVRVRKEGKRPLLIKRGRFDFLSATADSKGRFTIEKIDAGSLASLEAGHSHYARKALNTVAPGFEYVEVELEPGGTIRGKVIYEETGRPAGGVHLKCRERYSGRGREEAVSGEDGVFELRGLPSGTFLVVGEARSETEAADHIVVPKNDVIVEAGEVTADVELQLIRGLLISGRAYDEDTGEPVAGVRLGFFHQGGYEVVSTQTDGTYAVRVVPGRIWRKVESFPPDYYVKGGGWSGGQQSVLVGKEGEVLSDVDFALARKFGMMVKVVGEDGLGLGGTSVYYSEPGKRPVKETTDKDGKAFIELARQGADALIYAINEKMRRGAALLVRGRETLEREVTINLYKVPVIAGQVRDKNGEPISGASISCYAVAGGSGISTTRLEVPAKEIHTDEAGTYRLEELVPGNVEYQFEVFHEDYPLYVSKAFSLPNREELSYSDIVMQKADSFIAGTVTDADGNPVEGSWVEVYGSMAPEFAKSDKDGKYRIEGLPEGHVTVRIHHAKYGYKTFQDVATGFDNTDLSFSRPVPPAAPSALAGPTMPEPEELVGKDAPPIEVSAWLQSPQKALPDLKGSVVLVDFFAVWCTPCKEKLPEIEALHKKYRDRGLITIGLHGDENPPEEVTQYCEDLGLTFSVGMIPSSTSEEGARAYQSYGIQFLPFVVLIDKDGKVRHIDVTEGLEEKIEELLGE
jgi:thiol-disulfide isomerase/thioredoxin/protocatechuate 3,4-dioxygenase beta subunit